MYESGNINYADITPSASCSVLPQYNEQEVVVRQLSFVERFVNRFAPYQELCQAEQDSQFEPILGRLLTEWYVMGGSVGSLQLFCSIPALTIEITSYLQLQGTRFTHIIFSPLNSFFFSLNAAVFGFTPDATFSIDGLAKRAIAIGSIAAGIGLVADAWFIVAYSGADVTKFRVRTIFLSYT